MTFPYADADDLEHDLEDTAETVRDCIMYGDAYAQPIETVLSFVRANWQRFEDWIERNNEPDV